MENEIPTSKPQSTPENVAPETTRPQTCCCSRGWVVAGTVGAIVIALSVIALPVIWRGPDADKLTAWTEFFGTLHPVVLHLPIGIVILVVTMEVLGWISLGRYKPQTTLALGLGLLSAVAAVSLGYLLFMTGDYGKGTIDRGIGQHLWGTITFTVLLSAAFAAKLWNDYDGRRPILYAGLLIAASGVLTVSAHKGAIITHGSDPLDGLLYLIKPPDNTLNEGAPPTATDDDNSTAPVVHPGDLQAYDQVVVPLLKRYCYECHSEAGANPAHAAGKVKGKLSMTTLDSLKKGGSSDVPSLVPGDATKSLMVEVMRYDLDDDEHMPPEDSDQPSVKEIELLEWWINAGAPIDKTVTETGGGDAFFPIIDALHQPPVVAPSE